MQTDDAGPYEFIRNQITEALEALCDKDEAGFVATFTLQEPFEQYLQILRNLLADENFTKVEEDQRINTDAGQILRLVQTFHDNLFTIKFSMEQTHPQQKDFVVSMLAVKGQPSQGCERVSS